MPFLHKNIFEICNVYSKHIRMHQIDSSAPFSQIYKQASLYGFVGAASNQRWFLFQDIFVEHCNGSEVFTKF